ncbi:MAG TPA: hypothetical protein VMS08_06345 [Candidatus Saccharimonadia bacterium]|nr:hypothetical protein [Candidatus Saccharimonadia bacterium]
MQSEKPIRILINGTFLGSVAVNGMLCVDEHEELCWPALAYLAAAKAEVYKHNSPN